MFFLGHPVQVGDVPESHDCIDISDMSLFKYRGRGGVEGSVRLEIIYSLFLILQRRHIFTGRPLPHSCKQHKCYHNPRLIQQK